MTRFIFILIVFVWVTACDPVEITADLPDTGGSIVINGHFVPDSVWDINLTYSRSISKARYEYGYGLAEMDPITNATVKVFEEGKFLTTLTYRLDEHLIEKHHYVSHEGQPVAGKTYTIEVTTPNGKKATASCKIPLPSPIGEIKVGKTVSTITAERINGPHKDPYSFSVVPIDLTIDDPAGDNYYEVVVEYLTTDGRSPFVWPVPVMTNNPKYHNTGLPATKPLAIGADEVHRSVLFADRDQDAKKIKATLSMPVLLVLIDGEAVPDPDSRHRVILRTLSKEYFQFKASQEVQAYGSNDPFAQPVVIFNNVEGGLGIFAGMSESSVVTGYYY